MVDIIVFRRAIVEELVGLGARVHTCCRNEIELNKCLEEWDGMGFGITGSLCDVSVAAQREELMDTVSSVFDGKLNILVSSSSIIHFSYLDVYVLHLQLSRCVKVSFVLRAMCLFICLSEKWASSGCISVHLLFNFGSKQSLIGENFKISVTKVREAYASIKISISKAIDQLKINNNN